MMWGYEMTTWGWVSMIAFWAIVVGGIVWLVVTLSRHDQGGASNARRILDERFASGDITEEEYQQRRRALER